MDTISARVDNFSDKSSEVQSNGRAIQPFLDSNSLLAEYSQLTRQDKSSQLPSVKIEGHEAARKKTTSFGPPVSESEHVMTDGDDLTQIARDKLGQRATAQQIQDYRTAIVLINGLTDSDAAVGSTLTLPGRERNGNFVYTNQENQNEHFTLHRDGSIDEKNSLDGSSYHQQYLDTQSFSYLRQHHGPKASDNFTEAYFDKAKYTFKETKDANGNIHDEGSDGTVRDKDASGNSRIKLGNGSPFSDMSENGRTHETTMHAKDGSTITTTNKGVTTIVEKDGTRSVEDPITGTQTSERKDSQGREISTKKVSAKDGSYSLDSRGPEPVDNFHETYDSKTGKTVRTEAMGTPDEKRTTHFRNGDVQVENKNGDNFLRKSDGSEHHWGNSTFERPATDYKNDVAVVQTRKDLEQSINDHVPAAQQADFKSDMTAFESRAKKDHLPPEEIAKTYEQLNKLLTAPDSQATVPADNRAILAQQLMHQAANPDATSQGGRETCNVTTVAKETLAKNPSKMAEITTSIALSGKFTAPDGKEIEIDRQSLQPGAEERNPKTKDGERSFATQILNLAMVNDAFQRRNPPESYGQRVPDRAIPGDTGERIFEASGKIETASLARTDDNGTTKFIDGPLNAQNLSEHEISALSRSFNGDKSHLLDPQEQGGGVESVRTSAEFANKLQQYKDQGHFPILLSVDGNHTPVEDPDSERPGLGGHLINVTDYDARRGMVLISNNWDLKHNHWVSLSQLFSNSHGDLASESNGTDINFPDEILRQMNRSRK